MSNLSLKLSAFEGPLDLLLHMIDKDKIDIYDIPIVTVTEQYISYLRAQSEFDMEVASEFLVMAATLLQIKSRMLLPCITDDTEEEELDPRQQLVEMLLEYRRIKRAAVALNTMKQDAKRFFQRKPMFEGILERNIISYSARDLLEALAAVINNDVKQTAFIEPQAFSVKDKMAEIICMLRQKPQGFILNELLKSNLSGERVAAFLGILELLKMGEIRICQAQHFAPIYIFSKQEE